MVEFQERVLESINSTGISEKKVIIFEKHEQKKSYK